MHGQIDTSFRDEPSWPDILFCDTEAKKKTLERRRNADCTGRGIRPAELGGEEFLGAGVGGFPELLVLGLDNADLH